VVLQAVTTKAPVVLQAVVTKAPVLRSVDKVTQAVTTKAPVLRNVDTTTILLPYANIRNISSHEKQTEKREIVIVIPYRDREVHYKKIMEHLPSITRENWRLHTILVEQLDSKPFRRAWLMNIGIVEAKRRFVDDSICVVTHDVDMLVESKVDYGWCDMPTQICSELSCFNGGVPYTQSAGGVVQASIKVWYTINGFTNTAIGWGGEDDDLHHRFRINRLLKGGHLRRPAKGFGKCHCIHDKDHTKRVRDKKGYKDIVSKIRRMNGGSNEWKTDGLNSLKYYISEESKDKYGTIHLKVIDEPWYNRIDIVVPSSLGSEKSVEIERSRTDDHCTNIPSGKHWNMFKEVVTILNDLNVNYTIAAGTVLFWYRDCGMGASDIDFDVDYDWLVQNVTIFHNTMKRARWVQKYVFGKLSAFGYEESWTKDGIKVDFFSRAYVNGRYINGLTVREITYPCDSFLQSYGIHTWNGINFYVPEPIEPYLSAKYGNWKKKHIRGYRWDIDPFKTENGRKHCYKTKMPVRMAPKYSCRHIGWCGSHTSALILAKALFPECDIQKFDGNKQLSVIIKGLTTQCAGLSSFSGKVFNINGEATVHTSVKPKHYYLDHGGDKTFYFQYISLAAQVIGEAALSALKKRPQNTGERFLIYVSRRCEHFREKTFDYFSDIGQVYAASKCHGYGSKYIQDTENRGKNWGDAYKYMRRYRFALTLENKNTVGYHTEKILNAFAAGSVPIYFGSKSILNIFNKNAFVFYDPKNPKIAVERVLYLENNHTAYNEVLNNPILVEGALEKYFSLTDDIGGGQLKKRIRSFLLNTTIETVMKQPHPNVRPVLFDNMFEQCAKNLSLQIATFKDNRNQNIMNRIRTLMESLDFVWWLDQGGLIQTARGDEYFSDPDIDISYMPRLASQYYECTKGKYKCDISDTNKIYEQFLYQLKKIFPEFSIQTWKNKLHITLSSGGKKIIDFAPMVIAHGKHIESGFGTLCGKNYGISEGWPCTVWNISDIFPLQSCYATGVIVPCPKNLVKYLTLVYQREYIDDGIPKQRCHGCTKCLLWNQKTNGDKSIVDDTINNMAKLDACNFGSLSSLKPIESLGSYHSCEVTVKQIAPLLRGNGKYLLDYPNGMKQPLSWSQHGQDRWVDNFLDKIQNGFFVEIGGYDGEKFSNTLFLEKERGWDGLLIEANPYTFDILQSRDRKCSFVNACVSKTLEFMTFIISGSTTSAKETMTASFRKRIAKDILTYGKSGDKRWVRSGTELKVKCTKFGDLMSKLERKHIDYFSLDVEGAEMIILESIPFDKISISVFTIEIGQNAANIRSFMSSKGYIEKKILHGDLIFVSEKYK
jgi:hypothetical protein